MNIGREAPTTNNLFSMPRRRHGSREVCCDEKHARTCFNVDMNPDVILSADEITFDKITLTFSNAIPPVPEFTRRILGMKPSSASITGQAESSGH